MVWENLSGCIVEIQNILLNVQQMLLSSLLQSNVECTGLLKKDETSEKMYTDIFHYIHDSMQLLFFVAKSLNKSFTDHIWDLILHSHDWKKNTLYNISIIYFLDSPLSPSPSPPSRPNRKSSNGGQGAQGAQRGQEGQEGLARGQRLTYTERMEEEHTYTAVRGDRHYLRRFDRFYLSVS